ncbi:hypothetical protein BD413DRAFT_162052 [Trametes elegans]|nr:hypothetical protein BD413DRAFT_162052 [Trametes elegans]
MSNMYESLHGCGCMNTVVDRMPVSNLDKRQRPRKLPSQVEDGDHVTRGGGSSAIATGALSSVGRRRRPAFGQVFFSRPWETTYRMSPDTRTIIMVASCDIWIERRMCNSKRAIAWSALNNLTKLSIRRAPIRYSTLSPSNLPSTTTCLRCYCHRENRTRIISVWQTDPSSPGHTAITCCPWTRIFLTCPGAGSPRPTRLTRADANRCTTR